MTYCPCQLGIETIGFFLQRARKGKKIEKIAQERIETNHKVNLWATLGLEKQVHLKMVYLNS